jgi:hypothetical protein
MRAAAFARQNCSSWLEWVERLGDPRVVLARASIVLALVAIVLVGGWNAVRYPVPLGYDYQPNADYMHVLLEKHRLPTHAESQEAGQPPVYYLVGGIAARAGHWLFGWHEAPWTQLPEHSYRGAQLLNVLFVLVTAFLVLALARIVAPESPTVWAAAVGFFAFVPVVLKTAAMIHPETLNMMLSTIALWLATTIMRRPGLRLRLLLLLLAVVVVGLETRASMIFTAAAIGLAFLVHVRRHIRLSSLRRLLAPVLAVVVLAVGLGYWIGTGSRVGELAALREPFRQAPGSRAHFFDLPTKALFVTPYRANYVNAALPETYTEIWGDWIGAFAWSDYGYPPSPQALRILRDQSWIGLLPTLLALAGYVLLAIRTLRNRLDLLALALVVPIALGGYLVRSYIQMSPDGDLLKASYILTTAPVWALAFGLAFSRLGRFRLVQVGVGLTLVIFAVLELRFLVYGVRDGSAIF